jgi:hypothetical protein
VAITVAWGAMTVVIMRRQRRHRPIGVLRAQPRRRRMPSPAAERGGFVPLAPVATPAEAPATEVADEDTDLAPPEPESASEPAGPFEAYDRRPVVEPVPEELPIPAREPVDEASTYEIVWYREESRLVFALQPVDGRSSSGARHRSDHFTWTEDADPPADLRGAQSAHGRLRARLVREGWRPAGRGEKWFSHRFHPPSRRRVRTTTSGSPET